MKHHQKQELPIAPKSVTAYELGTCGSIADDEY